MSTVNIQEMETANTAQMMGEVDIRIGGTLYSVLGQNKNCQRCPICPYCIWNRMANAQDNNVFPLTWAPTFSGKDSVVSHMTKIHSPPHAKHGGDKAKYGQPALGIMSLLWTRTFWASVKDYIETYHEGTMDIELTPTVRAKLNEIALEVWGYPEVGDDVQDAPLTMEACKTYLQQEYGNDNVHEKAPCHQSLSGHKSTPKQGLMATHIHVPIHGPSAAVVSKPKPVVQLTKWEPLKVEMAWGARLPEIYGECAVCATTKKLIILIPCGHQVICESCISQSKSNDCPVCRTHIHYRLHSLTAYRPTKFQTASDYQDRLNNGFTGFALFIKSKLAKQKLQDLKQKYKSERNKRLSNGQGHQQMKDKCLKIIHANQEVIQQMLSNGSVGLDLADCGLEKAWAYLGITESEFNVEYGWLTAPDYAPEIDDGEPETEAVEPKPKKKKVKKVKAQLEKEIEPVD